MVDRQGLLRIFLISIECEGNTVSGNGAYASCIKRAAMSAGEVLVMCGRPCWEDGGGEDNRVLLVPLSKWGRLDRSSAWEEFAETGVKMHSEAVSLFAPDVVMAVDWTGSRALRALMQNGAAGEVLKRAAVLHLNFRVFFQSDGVPLGGEDAAFYRTEEAHAMELADVCVALNRWDCEAMHQLSGGSSREKRPAVEVLSPPLRRDIAMRAREDGAGDWRGGEGRSLILFCGRVTEEKNVMAFVQACELADLASAGCSPALIGHAADDDAYAHECLSRLAALPGAEIRGFVSARELAEVFSRSRMVCHPAAYEAWGMVIAEASAFGVPSVVHSGSTAKVGVCELLPVADGSIGIDFSQDAANCASRLVDIAKDAALLERVSRRARELSLEWDEGAHAEAVGRLIRQAIAVRRATC